MDQCKTTNYNMSDQNNRNVCCISDQKVLKVSGPNEESNLKR